MCYDNDLENKNYEKYEKKHLFISMIIRIRNNFSNS